MLMSTLTFDQTFEAAVAISSLLIICSAAWIVHVLIEIEKTKAFVFSSVLEDDGTGSGSGGGGDLQFEETTSESGNKQLEVEPADGSSPGGGSIEMSTRSPTRSPRRGMATSPNSLKMGGRRKQRSLSWMFVGIQVLSVSVLILLTYLLLVVSSAPVFLRILGSLCVFGVFLRYQIGDELRRQRIDRIMLLLSLFLVIASMLSALVYSMKTLLQGEIYEGPARIVGYDLEQYNNTQHDPTTRTDIAVSWGKEWGCPLSGGKVCQSRIQGAMCQSHPEQEQTKHKPNYGSRSRRRNRNRNLYQRNRQLKDNQAAEEEEELEEDLMDEEDSNEDLESENEKLEKENEELEEEIEELKEETEIEDEENDELVDQENSELNEIVDEYDEDIMVVEEEEYDEAQDYVDAEYEEDEEDLEEKIETTNDDATKEALEDELDEDAEDQKEVDEEYEEDEELLDEYADEYADAADEEYDEFANEQDTTEALEEEEEEVAEEVEETESEISDTDSSSNGGESNDDVYDEMAEEIYEEEEEEVEEEYEEEEYGDDDWYWDENPDYYDDDSYEDEYWNYDWDSVWGDYSCTDLFDSDIAGQTYDVNTPAGGDDEWPFVNIYGSCKTCEAYILDYFAEEAFEETQEYKQQAMVYLAGAMAGFIWSFLSYIKYRVMPTAENEVELLGGDGGVMA